MSQLSPGASRPSGERENRGAGFRGALLGGPEVSRSFSQLLRGKGSRKSQDQEEVSLPRWLAEEWEGEVQAPSEAGRV